MTGAMRLGRGLVVTLVIVLISAAFHTAGGGCLSHFSSIGFLLLTAGTFLSAVWLSSREWTLPRLLALVAVAQLGFHALFEVIDRIGEPTSLIAGTDDSLSHSPAMLLAHIAAALAIVAVLRSGERWLLAFVTILASLLPRPVAQPSMPFPATTVLLPQAPKESGLRRILFTLLLTHRGPPAGAVALATA